MRHGRGSVVANDQTYPPFCSSLLYLQPVLLHPRHASPERRCVGLCTSRFFPKPTDTPSACRVFTLHTEKRRCGSGSGSPRPSWPSGV